MNDKEERIQAQLITYFQRVITNAANNYYKKKFALLENELLDETLIQEQLKQSEIPLATITVLHIPLVIENETLLALLMDLNQTEQLFLLEKFVFDKTDQEIGVKLGISRQGVTNLKKRLYKKLHAKL